MKTDKEIREKIKRISKQGKIKNDLISKEMVLDIIRPRLSSSRKGSLEYQKLNSIFVSIQNLPVIYDVDKVIQEMAEGIEDNVDYETGEPCDNWVVDMQNDLISRCMLIVQAGYLEEETKI